MITDLNEILNLYFVSFLLFYLLHCDVCENVTYFFKLQRNLLITIKNKDLFLLITKIKPCIGHFNELWPTAL